MHPFNPLLTRTDGLQVLQLFACATRARCKQVQADPDLYSTCYITNHSIFLNFTRKQDATASRKQTNSGTSETRSRRQRR